MIENLRGKKVFISGKITGEEETYKFKFMLAEEVLANYDTRTCGKFCTILNPSVLPLGLLHKEYLDICFAMIDSCDAVVFLRDWKYSQGATKEHEYAKSKNKDIYYYDDLVSDRLLDELIDLRDRMQGDIAREALIWAIEVIKKNR